MVEGRVVVLTEVPVRLFLESQDHQHDLIRELQLINLGDRFDLGTRDSSPQLADLIGTILRRYHIVRSATRAQAVAALERGEETLDLRVPVEPGMAEALRSWLRLLDRADEVCARGLLLLPPPSPAVQALRRDYVDRLTALIERTQPV